MRPDMMHGGAPYGRMGAGMNLGPNDLARKAMMGNNRAGGP